MIGMWEFVLIGLNLCLRVNIFIVLEYFRWLLIIFLGIICDRIVCYLSGIVMYLVFLFCRNWDIVGCVNVGVKKGNFMRKWN